MDIQYRSTVLFVTDIERSKAFYTQVMGCKVADDFGVNVGLVGGLALWQAGHLQTVMPIQCGPEPLGRNNLETYFEVEDLDTLVARIKEVNAPLVHPVVEQPWGQRAVRFRDPDGHIVEAGEPMPVVVRRMQAEGLTAEEIAGKTGIPVAGVEIMLAS